MVSIDRVPRTAGESRWPASTATLAAVGLYAALPNGLLVGPRYIIPAIELVMLTVVVIENPRRMTKQTRRSRILALCLTYLIMFSNLVSLVLLLRRLVSRAPTAAANCSSRHCKSG